MGRILLLLILFSNTVFYGQKEGQAFTDSLIAVLPKMKEDTLKVKTLNELAILYQNDNPEIGIATAQKALALSKKLDWNYGIAKSYNTMAINYQVLSKTDKALLYYHLALKNTNNKTLTSKIYKNLGALNYDLCEYTKALDYGFKALKLSEALKDQPHIAKVSTNIGNVYYTLKLYDKAIFYYEKSLKISIETNNKMGTSKNYMNLGNGYNSVFQDNKAIFCYKKAAELSLELGDRLGRAYAFSALAEVYSLSKMYDEAIRVNDSSIVIAQELGNEKLALDSWSSKGSTYLDMAQEPNYKMQQQALLTKANIVFNRVIILSKKAQNRKLLASTYLSLALIHKLQGNYKLALDVYDEAIIYKDSIYNEDTKETLKNLEDKRTIELRDKQIQLNKATLQSKEREKWLYISGIAFLLIIAGLILMQSRNRKKNNEKLQQLNADLDHANKVKARFFSILNHDLRSPVASLISFLHLQKESPELLDEQSKKRMENKTISSAENLLDSMEDLLLWSKGQMENFKPQPANIKIAFVFDDLQKHFSAVENVKLIFENPTDISVFTDENYVKTILRNLTGNAIKALEKTQNATVILSAVQSEGKVKISVSDNGPGGTIEKFKALYDENEVVGIKTGLGLHLIRDLAKAIDCKIAVDTNIGSGTTFTILFQ